MPFIIETWDKPGHAPMRTRERDVHLAYLEANKSLLLACGAKLEADDLQAGRQILCPQCQKIVSERRKTDAGRLHYEA